MSDPMLEAEAEALTRELREADPAEGVIRAQAMMIAATGFLTRLAGHEAVAAMLRADADTVASFQAVVGEPVPPPAELH